MALPKILKSLFYVAKNLDFLTFAPVRSSEIFFNKIAIYFNKIYVISTCVLQFLFLFFVYFTHYGLQGKLSASAPVAGRGNSQETEQKGLKPPVCPQLP